VTSCVENTTIVKKHRELPSHLQSLVDNCSSELSDSPKQSVTELILDYQDIFVGVIYHTRITHGQFQFRTGYRVVINLMIVENYLDVLHFESIHNCLSLLDRCSMDGTCRTWSYGSVKTF
jgi:hypothetical protein